MGSGKTSWVIDLLNRETEKKFLYVTPFVDETERIQDSVTERRMYCPINHGDGKIGNIASLLNNHVDIASTHELFRRFGGKCKAALEDNNYILILDETLNAVQPYTFEKKDDCQYLLEKNDITVDDDGLIEWTGCDLETRFDDVRILSKNKCLYRVDKSFYLWMFPHEIFSLFDEIYIFTYLFDGSIMKYYFDLYNLQYDVKSIKQIDNKYCLVDYYKPDISKIRNRLDIYEGGLNTNISSKQNMLSVNWCKSSKNKDELKQLKNNFYNYRRNIIDASGAETIWTTFKDYRSKLTGEGHSNSFVFCNCRATNEYEDRTCVMYGLNWYVNPEIVKFFSQHGITIDQEKIALSNMLQWIWRSNIRKKDSDKIIHVYIPSIRMRRLLLEWLNN